MGVYSTAEIHLSCANDWICCKLHLPRFHFQLLPFTISLLSVTFYFFLFHSVCRFPHTHTTTFYCLQSTQIHAKCTLYGTRIFYYLAFALLPDFCRRREPSQVWNFGSFELIKNNLQLLVFSTWNSRALSCWICFHWITSGCTQKTFHIIHIQRTLELEEQRKNMTMEHKLFCRGKIFISLGCNILLINEIKLDLLGDRHQLIPYPNKYPPDWLRCHQLWQLFSHSIKRNGFYHFNDRVQFNGNAQTSHSTLAFENKLGG